MLNLEQTIISQYANSPTLTQLIENMNAYLDPTANLIKFYNYVWNVDTAVGFGLDIWGRIVGVSRVIPIPGTNGTFGFQNADSPPDWQNFGSKIATSGGPFYAGQTSTGSYTLNDTAFRTLILAKALANIVATTAPALNQLIQNLFPGRGRAYTVDNRNMTMTYVFRFPLSTIEYAILAFSGVLPHPGGVGVNILVIPSGNFGFREAAANGNVTTWGYGNFYKSG
jgi:Protein of unknown function (DUF2612)